MMAIRLDTAAWGRVLCVAASVSTATLYALLAFRLSAEPSGGRVVVFGAAAALTLLAGSVAPFMSFYHVYLALLFVYLPPVAYLLTTPSPYRWAALGGGLTYLAGCILSNVESRPARTEP